MSSLSMIDREETLALCKLSGHMMRKRLALTAAAIAPMLQSGWKGTYKQLAVRIDSSENAVIQCVQTYAVSHPEWPRTNIVS